MANEADLMRRLQKLASELGARLFRQNTGMAWVGNARQFSRTDYVRVEPGDVVIRKARPFHAGVTGMSDLGGWTPAKVTAEMVGTTVAIYTQVEVKDGARVTKEQDAWISAVRNAGGRAGVAHNAEDLSAIIRGAV